MIETLQSKITYIEPSLLTPYLHNARTHSKKQIGQIAKSIKEFGFTNPVLIDGKNNIIAGHGRVLAASELKLPSVPTILLEHLTEKQKKAYIIADNKLAEAAGWDNAILKIELGQLIDLDFDLDVIGFETGEIDFLINIEEGKEDDSSEPQPIPENPVTQLGDLWRLGEHTIYCGNSLDQSSYRKVLNTKRANMVFTDPPYNVPIQGHVSGLGKTKHQEFAMASGEMSKDEFTSFLSTFINHTISHSVDGSLHFIFMDWRHLEELLLAGKSYTELKNLCVWDKTIGGMGSLYRSQHEMVFIFKNGKRSHINNVELGKHGRNRTNIWSYPGANSLKNPNKHEELKMHPTVKPINLVADAIMDCSNIGDLILDPFGGSGTTLLAAEKTRRKSAIIELDPGYVDVTLKRFQEATGIDPILAENGKTFRHVMEDRNVKR